MNKYRRQEAWRLALVVAAGVISGLITSHLWAGLAIALLLYNLWLLRYIFKLNQWIDNGLKRSQAPNACGVLENIISKIYRLRTNQKRGKKRLAKLLRQFRALAEALPEANIILTTTGEIQWFNEAAENLLGLQSPRDLGTRIENLLRDPEFRYFLHAADQTKVLRLASPKDASIIYCSRLISYGKNNVLLTVRDISVQETVDRVRREFISNASHELRTPLTVIRGYLEVMSTDSTCMNDVHEKILIILEQTNNMDNIINEMLTLSRLEHTSLKPEEGEVINVTMMLQQLVLDAVQSGKAVTGQITFHTDETLCLYGMKHEISSVCSNLLYNALQHNPAHTAVELQWFCSGAGKACLTVNDDGQGIEPRHLSRLTERFYRVDSSRSRESGGTGLGLAIVKHIVQRHGGQVDISSTPGVGSSFTCCFAGSRKVECEKNQLSTIYIEPSETEIR